MWSEILEKYLSRSSFLVKFYGYCLRSFTKNLLHRNFSRSLIMDIRISIFTERLSVAAFSTNRCDTDVVIRNFRKMQFRTIGISTKYRTNYESAATINNFRHIKNYIPFIWHLSRFPFTSSYHALFFFQLRLLFCIIFATRVLPCELYKICLMILFRRSST